MRKGCWWINTVGVACLQLFSCSNDPTFTGTSRTPEADATGFTEETFDATVIENAELGLNFDSRYVTQRIRMKEKPNAALSITQEARPIVTIEKTQGHNGSQREDSFRISEAGKLDVLVVVDDSASMADKQDRLANQMPQFMENLDNTDWQVGVISMSNPCVSSQYLIRKGETSDQNVLKQRFSSAIERAQDPDATEQGFLMALKALGGPCGFDKPWLRSDATLAILYLSDEDDCGSDIWQGQPEQRRCDSAYSNSQGVRLENSTFFLDSLKKLRPSAIYPARVYGLIRVPNGPLASCKTNEVTKESCEFEKAIKASGGLSGSILGDFDEYGRVLKKVAADIEKIITREFQLPFDPDGNTFEISVSDSQGKKPIQDGFSRNGRKVGLDQKFSDFERIYIKYSYGAQPKFKRLGVQSLPDLNTFKVSINGKMLATNQFYFDEAEKTLYFVDEPEPEAKVKIEYREVKKLRSSFALNLTDVRPETVRIMVDGQPAQNVMFDPRSSTLEFVDAPTDGQKIDVVYTPRSNKYVRYPKGFKDPRRPQRMHAFYEDIRQAIAIKELEDDVEFQEDDVKDGAPVIVVYDYGEKPRGQTVTLQGPLEEGTLDIQTDGGREKCGQDVKVDGQTLSFQCDASDYRNIMVKYQYLKEHRTKFTLATPFAADDKSFWKVFINDQEVSQFKRDGKVLELPAALVPHKSKVKVRVYQLAQ